MSPFTPKLISVPTPLIDADREAAFSRLYSDTLSHIGGIPKVSYACPYPKHEFLHYLVVRHRLLIHGSNRSDIELLEPRAESDNAGRIIHAVFAASDGIWPMFFAILDRKPYPFSVNNGCRRTPEGKTYHFSTSTRRDEPWTEGTMYLLPRDSFEQLVDGEGQPTDQWMSRQAVRPLASLAVSPSDFPLLREVQYHEHG
jgi:hypothetical protein